MLCVGGVDQQRQGGCIAGIGGTLSTQLTVHDGNDEKKNQQRREKRFAALGSAAAL